jgi:hypothetical protein
LNNYPKKNWGKNQNEEVWPNGNGEDEHEVIWCNRRKFGSQTSDNMERWKSSQQGEESEVKRSEERRCRCAKR